VNGRERLWCSERCRKRAARLRARQERARQAVVVDLVARRDAGPPTDRVGSAEAAVKAELDGMPEAERRPGLAAAAMSMAKLLDDPASAPQAPAAARVLRDLLDVLREPGGLRTGALARLRAARVEEGG
jgi:hypothetical protein